MSAPRSLVRRGVDRVRQRPTRRAAVAAAILAIAVVAFAAVGYGQITRQSAVVQPLPSGSRGPDAVLPTSPSPRPASASCTRVATADASGATDATSALQALVTGARGAVICLAPGGQYRVEGTLDLGGTTDLTIDGRGARIFATQRSGDPRIVIGPGASGATVRNLTIEGFWPEAGTPDAVVPAYEGNHGIAVRGASDVAIGPVVITDVAGDGVYLTSGGEDSPVTWADRIRVHDSTIKRTGRMGVAITDGARNVAIDHNVFEAIALYAFDIEPNGHVFDGQPAGADAVRFSDNRIGAYGLSSVLTPLFMAGTGNGPETNVQVSRNVVTGRPLRIGVWSVEGSARENFWITDNVSDTVAAGPTMTFEGVKGLTLSGNTQPLSGGPLAKISDSVSTAPTPP
jgi:parallel beta helix pectate lyase-like protein